MRIWIVGILLFIGWATFSSYHYVCIVKGLCNDNQSKIIDEEPLEEITAMDTGTIDAVTKQQIEFVSPHISFRNGTDQIIETSALAGAAYQLRDLASQQEISIKLEGHTDNSGSTEFNHKLGLQRAQSLRKYLMENGIDGSIIEVESFGELRPLALNNSAENRAKNRRVEIIVHQTK